MCPLRPAREIVSLLLHEQCEHTGVECATRELTSVSCEHREPNLMFHSQCSAAKLQHSPGNPTTIKFYAFEWKSAECIRVAAGVQMFADLKINAGVESVDFQDFQATQIRSLHVCASGYSFSDKTVAGLNTAIYYRGDHQVSREPFSLINCALRLPHNHKRLFIPRRTHIFA